MPYKNREKQRECQRRWYKNHTEKRKDEVKQRRKEIKNWLRNYKSKRACIKCGENHIACLEFHHKNGNKDSEITSMCRDGYSIKRIKEEISKCDLLCANCHRKEHNP